ncbi:MAG: hypothetical protein ACLQGP_11210 [Isosphaeraceae bacterium]
MQRQMKRLERLWWSLTLALVVLLMPPRETNAQMVGFGAAVGYPGTGFYNGFPMVNYPFTSFGNAYPGMGYGMGYGGMGYGGMGYGGMGYGGMGYGGMGYGAGYAGFYGTGWRNPMFGVGLTPLGTQSYMMETRLFNRVPRPTTYYRSAYQGR